MNNKMSWIFFFLSTTIFVLGPLFALTGELAAQCRMQLVAEQSLSLSDKPWKFATHVSHNRAISLSTYDRQWRDANLQNHWEELGIRDLVGNAWYRCYNL